MAMMVVFGPPPSACSAASRSWLGGATPGKRRGGGEDGDASGDGGGGDGGAEGGCAALPQQVACEVQCSSCDVSHADVEQLLVPATHVVDAHVPLTLPLLMTVPAGHVSVRAGCPQHADPSATDCVASTHELVVPPST